MDLQLPPSINDVRGQALLALINRLGAIDLTPILVYRIPSLVDSAVLAMAWQWDVLNPLLLPDLAELITLAYGAWDAIANIDALNDIDQLLYQAATEGSSSDVYAEYRALILLSTALHSTIGTPAALLNALAGLGYDNATLQEGQNSWGGTQWSSNEGWAVFRVGIPLADVPAGTDFSTLEQRLTAMANYWKPARCWLDSIQFSTAESDALMPAPSDFVVNIFARTDFVSPQVSDFIVAPAWPVSDTKTIVPLHDGRYYHIGTTYGVGEPHVADNGVVVNGIAISANG
jgi:Phage tail protein (Tail_P2_I)